MKSPKYAELLEVHVVGKTHLQLEHAYKPFIGNEFEMVCFINNINNTHLDVGFDSKKQPSNQVPIISFDETEFQSQLLIFNIGDEVSLKARLLKVDIGLTYAGHYFSLSSIKKTPPS